MKCFYCLSRLCELQRVCYGEPAGAQRTLAVEQSLKLSRYNFPPIPNQTNSFGNNWFWNRIINYVLRYVLRKKEQAFKCWFRHLEHKKHLVICYQKIHNNLLNKWKKRLLSCSMKFWVIDIPLFQLVLKICHKP